MPHDVAFHQGLHCSLRQNQSSKKEIQYFLKIKTCNPSKKYNGPSRLFIVWIFMEFSIGLERVKWHKAKSMVSDFSLILKEGKMVSNFFHFNFIDKQSKIVSIFWYWQDLSRSAKDKVLNLALKINLIEACLNTFLMVLLCSDRINTILVQNSVCVWVEGGGGGEMSTQGHLAFQNTKNLVSSQFQKVVVDHRTVGQSKGQYSSF